MRGRTPLSPQAMKRLTVYLHYLKALPEGRENISATAIAEGVKLHDVQVRKDLAAVSSGGRPKIGYNTASLITDLECYLGCDATVCAVLAGVGNLGRALLHNHDFDAYGLQIVAGFDVDSAVIGQRIGGAPILPMQSLPDVCGKAPVQIGIITVPEQHAQETCERMLDCGIRGIWNFAPVTLNVPAGVHVHNENMAASLAILSKKLAEQVEGGARTKRERA